MHYYEGMDDDLFKDKPAIATWVLREQRKYFQRRLYDLKNLRMKVYF